MDISKMTDAKIEIKKDNQRKTKGKIKLLNT